MTVAQRGMLPDCLRALIVGLLMLWPGSAFAEELADSINYVGSATCGACHDDAFEAWSDSHHGWALREADETSVLGRFDGDALAYGDSTTRFFRENGDYFVETDGPDGRPGVYQILYTVGVTPLQQYLVETDGGRLQALDIAWDTLQERWYHLYPDDVSVADEGLHWTGPYKNWQARCAVCHQTDFQKNYDAQTQTYQSTWSDLTVGCEACHGPGAAHVAWAEADDGADYAETVDFGLAVGFADLPERAGAEIEVCAPCHSRRAPLDADSPTAGSLFADHHVLSLLRDGLYHADGQIDAEVYVYGSFLQSKMYASGVTCTNCHDPHGGELVADGNAVCMQCHNPVGRDDFPSLVLADYDSPDHHHHPIGSEGAQCVACHMPDKAYMIVDPRRDHSFRVPRPDLGEVIGAPDACTSCHAGQTQAWAAAQIATWYPDGQWTQPHYGEVLFAGRTDFGAQTTDLLAALAEDTQAAGIVRASAIELLGERLDQDIAPRLYPFLLDDDSLVRLATVNALRFAPDGVRGAVIAPMMLDPIRSVRVAAARNTVDIPTEGLSAEEVEIVNLARADLRTALSATLDYPETQMQIGGIAMTLRSMAAADAAFKEAVTLDPNLIDAWMMRARIALASGDLAATDAVLAAALEHNPDSTLLLQSHGNVLADRGRLEDALASLEAAASNAPLDPTVRVDIAAVHAAAGNNQAALASLERAGILGADGPEYLELLALTQYRLGDVDAAAETAARLSTAFPDYPQNPDLIELQP